MAEGDNSGDLMSSGKVVAEATMSVFSQKNVEGVDKKKVAGAAAELLDSASTYGKLDDKPVGQYVDKAESYLKEFSTGSGGSAEKEKAEVPAGNTAPKPEEGDTPKEPAAPAPVTEEGKSGEGFGLDDVMKGAESVMEKKGDGKESGGGSGAGGLFNMAKGFMK